MRDRYNAFIERHDIAWELVMGALAIAYLAVGFMSDDATGATARTLSVIETGITAIFVAEFATRIAAAYDRPAYLKGHWIDLLALIPAVRQFRLLRLLRLLRLVRALAGVHRALMHVEGLLAHRSVVNLVVIWLGVMVFSSLGLYAAEHGANDLVDSPLDALWWGIVTMTTVGYGDVYPVTPEGRVAAVVLMTLGIALFSVLTATATSLLVVSGRNGGGAPVADQLRELAKLRDEGILTEQEFDGSKSRLLSELTG
jgi:voltage-gated potassium channel